MANPLEGFGNLGNLNNLASMGNMSGMGGMGSLGNFGGLAKLGGAIDEGGATPGKNVNVSDFDNIGTLDNFISSADNPELLQGIVTQIQDGDYIDPAQLSELSEKDREFATDLKSLNGTATAKDVVNKFSDLMGKYMDNVDKSNKDAEKAVETFASGGNIDLHSVMIASEKANLSMQLTLQLRNKILQAYQEIHNIHV